MEMWLVFVLAYNGSSSPESQVELLVKSGKVLKVKGPVYKIKYKSVNYQKVSWVKGKIN